jgi:hypothetical protein
MRPGCAGAGEARNRGVAGQDALLDRAGRQSRLAHADATEACPTRQPFPIPSFLFLSLRRPVQAVLVSSPFFPRSSSPPPESRRRLAPPHPVRRHEPRVVSPPSSSNRAVASDSVGGGFVESRGLLLRYARADARGGARSRRRPRGRVLRPPIRAPIVWGFKGSSLL